MFRNIVSRVLIDTESRPFPFLWGGGLFSNVFNVAKRDCYCTLRKNVMHEKIVP